MATWKKVIVSGSNADLAQITSSAGILNSGDLRSLGDTFLGNAQSDAHHITGSIVSISGSLLRMTGDTPRIALRDDPTSPTEHVSLGFAGGGGQLTLTDSAGNTKARISNANNNYLDRNLKIGGGFGNPSYKLDVQGDGRFLTNLFASGSLRVGDSGADSHMLSGSVGINMLGNFEVQNNVGMHFKVEPGNNTVQIHPDNATRKTFINTNSQIGSGIVSIASSVATSDSVTIGVGQTNTAAALFVTGSSRFSGSVVIDGTLTVTSDTLQEDLQTTGTTQLGNDMSDKTEVTGSLNVTGSSFFQGTGIFSGSSAKVTIDPYSSDNIITIKNSVDSSTDKIVFLKSDNTEMANLANRGSRAELVLKNNGADSIKISNFNNSFHAPNFAIGSTSEDTNNTLSVTGNIKATTGITGSYLTDNKLLTAGSVGQIESSAITWDDTTLTVGSSGAGHVYATQVTASEVKISSLAADRIVFTNADKQLEDSTNLQYDDDGGLNVGGKLTLTGDLQVSHNLTVQGTASFQHTEDLDVADRFIRMASGSTSTGDGGIAIQQTGPTDTEGFGYDSGQSRWGVTSSFDASQNALAPVAFMPLAINGTDNNPTSNQVANETRYKKAGNIYIDTDASMEEGGVWIYV